MEIGERTSRDLPWGNRHYILLLLLTNTDSGSINDEKVRWNSLDAIIMVRAKRFKRQIRF